MKYKVGDKVVPRKDLRSGKTYPMETGGYSDDCVQIMLDVANTNEYLTITRASGWYWVEEDGENWCWTDGMFVGLVGGAEVVDNNPPALVKILDETSGRESCEKAPILKGMVGKVIDTQFVRRECKNFLLIDLEKEVLINGRNILHDGLDCRPFQAPTCWWVAEDCVERVTS